MHILTAATAVVVLCAGAACAIGRFPGLADKATFVSPQGKGPWELKDPKSILKEFNSSKFPPNVGLRVRSCAALESKQKVHGTEKMADQINLLATGLIKIMARSLPPLQRVAIGMISDACSGFWKVQFTVGEGKRCEKLMLEGLCLLERGFPSYTIHTTIFYYCVHIASHWRKFGPPRLCNCFVFERHIGAMVSTLQSRGLYVASVWLYCICTVCVLLCDVQHAVQCAVQRAVQWCGACGMVRSRGPMCLLLPSTTGEYHAVASG